MVPNDKASVEAVPTMSSFAAGAVEPIPTLPLLLIKKTFYNKKVLHSVLNCDISFIQSNQINNNIV